MTLSIALLPLAPSPDVGPGILTSDLFFLQLALVWIGLALGLICLIIGLRRWRFERRSLPDLPLSDRTISISIAGLFFLSLIICVATDWSRGWREEAGRRHARRGFNVGYIYVPDPKPARLMAVGNYNLFADFYWIRMLENEASYRLVEGVSSAELTERFARTMLALDPRWGGPAILGGMSIASKKPKRDDPLSSWTASRRFLADAFAGASYEYRLPRQLGLMHFESLPFETESRQKTNNWNALNWFETALKTGERYNDRPELCPTPLEVWSQRKRAMLEISAALRLADANLSPWKKVLMLLPRRASAAQLMVDQSNSRPLRVNYADDYMRWESEYRCLVLQRLVDEINSANRLNPNAETLWRSLPELEKWKLIRNAYARYRNALENEINAELRTVEGLDGKFIQRFRDWNENETPVDAARIPLFLTVRTDSNGWETTHVESVWVQSMFSQAKQGGLRTLSRAYFHKRYGRYPRTMDELSAYFHNEFIGAQSSQRVHISTLNRGNGLQDDLLGGRFEIVNFPADDDGVEPEPVFWTRSAFAVPAVKSYGADEFLLNSFDDIDAVRAFFVRLINSDLPPFFLSNDAVRKPSPADYQAEPARPANNGAGDH